MTETLQLRGTLLGHNGWVTQIATNPKDPDTILSSSRDKTLIVWKLTRDDDTYGFPQKRLYGYSHFISDVVLSSDGNYALSRSWDKTLRLWDLAAGKTTRRFEDHTRDVLSVAFSADNRQIVSGSRDKTIKLWNTLAECKYTIQEDGHSDWVLCVRFSPNHSNPVIVSCGWDRTVKVCNLTNCKLKNNHQSYLNTVTVSPDGSLCTSGGKDSKALLWDLNDSKNLYTIHQDLGFGMQENCRRTSTRSCHTNFKGRSTAMLVAGLVNRRTNFVRWLLGQHNSCMASCSLCTLRNAIINFVLIYNNKLQKKVCFFWITYKKNTKSVFLT